MPPPITTISYRSSTREPPSTWGYGPSECIRAPSARSDLRSFRPRKATVRGCRHGLLDHPDDRAVPTVRRPALLVVASGPVGSRVQRLVGLAGARHRVPAGDD